MDRNAVVLSGSLASVSQRPVGAQGRMLYEVRLDVTKPAARGREAEVMTVPCVVWAPELGLAVEMLDVGTPVTVIGRISARAWTPAGGGAEKLFVEIVGEQVLIDATMAASGEPVEPAPAARPVTEPAAPSRPSSARPASRSEVPF